MESLQDQIAARIAQDSEAAMRAGMSPMAQRIRFEGDIRDRDIQARASYDPVSIGVDLAFYELN